MARILLAALLLPAVTGKVLAEEISDLRWLPGDDPVFAITASPDMPFTTEVLDNGYRLRIAFPDASLARNIRDIGESGIVRGVFPYETDSPDRANFDVLLKTQGGLKIVPLEGGFEVAVLERGQQPVADASTNASAPSESLAGQAAPPAASMNDLERSVLAEIDHAQKETVADTSNSDRTRVVLQPRESDTETETETESVAATKDASQTAQVDAVEQQPVAQADAVEQQSASVAIAAADEAPPPSFEVQLPTTSNEVPEPPRVAADADTVTREQVTNAQQAISGNAGIEESVPVPAPAPAPEVVEAPAMPVSGDVAGARLEAITYSELPGGRLQVNFNLVDGDIEPGVFRTNQPPRIVIDFFGTANGVLDAIQRVGFGALESIVTAETDDRTRVILNLVAPVDYEQRRVGDDIVVVMESPNMRQVSGASNARQRPAFQSVGQPNDLEFAVADIDFRRTPEGGGTITVRMTSPEIGVDVHEEAGEIVIDFPGVDLPAELEKRLDVVDFATPVQTVDTFFTGAGARMIISPVGQYSYSSYQVGETLTVQVSPMAEDDDQREPDEFGYSGERLSFNFQRISVRAALQVIADFTGLNFVTSDSVTGDLSLRLQDVPWDQALDTILQVKGLAKRQKGNVVWVAPAEEIAAKERQALEAQSQVYELEPLVSELIQINYAKANEIANILKSVRAIDTGYEQSLFGSVTISEIETDSNSLLSSRGSVTVDARTNTLLVQDTRGKIREVRKLIAQLDRPVRQVLIETRIVEANDDFSRNIGARLGFTRVTENARFPGASDSNIGTVIGSASLEDNDLVRSGGSVGDRAGVSVDLSADGQGGQSAASYAFTLAKAGAGFSHLIDLEISALEAEGTGKVIANPRLLTTDQNQARIEQGQERVFTTSVLGEGSVVTKKAVLGLTVTPQITPDDRLVLDVFVTKDSFAAADDTTINTKQIRTKVLLDNGETVVIGGIYEQSQSESTTKVPLLGDIPLLGALFRKRNKFDNRTELLIFLTPRILDPALTVN
ncbi:MAG: type IV pilus secretin PilQ [Proteobacteria bacterium]|nr:MAG: type IV pilus secretin PilQ [Pseudomonadota bacterium]